VQECYSAASISDHEIVVVTLESQALYNPSNSYKVFLWNKANFSELKENMCKFTTEFCNHFSDETSVETLWTCLGDKLLFLLDKFVPSKLKNINNRQPWINRNIKQLRQQKQASYNIVNRARFTKSSVNWSRYKELKRICNGNAEKPLKCACSLPHMIHIHMIHIKMARRKDCFAM